jgi:hypothetical protein
MLLRSPVLTWFRSPVDTWFRLPVEALFLSDVDTFVALSLPVGVCDVPGLAAALSLAAADWFPPLIDLSDVRVPDETWL